MIPMTIFLQASRSLVEPHSSVSVQFVTALMSSSHRAIRDLRDVISDTTLVSCLEVLTLLPKACIVGKIVKSRMKWAGHMVRMKDEKLPKRSETKKHDGCRKRGRPQLR